MLDCYMKGFLNGAFFDEGFVHEWQISRTQDKGLLKEHLIDVHEYCIEHLGADTQYFSIRELIDHFEILEAVKEASQGDIDTLEGTLLSDYSGFNSSFRIIAHQNKIQKVSTY